MSYVDAFELLNKLWLDSTDIQRLLSCGKDSARKIRDDVSNMIKEKGYELPMGKNKKVLTKEVVEYLGIDMDYIEKMAMFEHRNRIENYAGISK